VIASILVCLFTVGGAYATNRASTKASRINTDTTSRVDMEKDAYIRARAFDVSTIERQDEELAELRAKNKALEAEVKLLNARIERLERGLPPIQEENI
jgi:peptidoglycan hydrolase CwlO-like protein